MSKSIKCQNCGHVIYWDEHPPFGDNPEWSHKGMLHDDNCECRKPVPNWKSLQKVIIKDVAEAIEKYKNEPKPRYDRSRGWDSIPFEEKFRPFTI